MISKQYFEETFSLATAQSLQEWADNNLITQTEGDYGMKVSYVSAGEMFSETTLAGLTIGEEYVLKATVKEIVSDTFRIFVTDTVNDHTSPVVELGYGLGQRTAVFTATATTMYLSIGDVNSQTNTYSISDNISVKNGIVDYVTNGTFEGDSTAGWTAYNSVVDSYPYAGETEPPVGDNPYIEPVDIPVYDAGNTEHCLIPTDEPFLASTFNDATYTNFYILPGEHGTLNGDIIRSGTSIKRRTISLHNGNDTHPGKLTTGELAQYQLTFNGGSYWTIDRMASVDKGGNGIWFKWLSDSTNNIINRPYFHNFDVAVFIQHTCHYNTVQQGRFEDMTLGSFQSDLSTIQVVQSTNTGLYPGIGSDFFVYGTKCILNEFKDAKPGRLNRYVNQNCEFKQTVIDSNMVDYTSEYYCDVNGNITPDGDYYAGESGFFSQKHGTFSTLEEDRIQWTNNIQIGARPASPGIPNISGGGIFMIAYRGAENIDYLDNFNYDCMQGINLGDSDDDTVYGSVGVVAKRNTFVQCGTTVVSKVIMTFYQAHQATVEDNAIIRPVGTNRSIQVSSCSGGSSISNNDICVPGGTSIYWYTNNGDTTGEGTNIEYATEADGGYTEDKVFTKNTYTNNPIVVTIPNCVKP